MTSPCEKVIRRDIDRTYPHHEFFKEKHGLGQESLFNVIKVREMKEKISMDHLFFLQAYSLYDREVGYCQGIGFIVGLFLMHVCGVFILRFSFSSFRFYSRCRKKRHLLC